MPERNLELTAWLRDSGMTIGEFAEAISNRMEHRTGRTIEYSDRSVRRLLSGDTIWPHPPVRQALEDLCEVSAVDLGFTPPAGTGRIRPTGVPSEIDGTHRHEEAPVRRRELFGIGGGTILSIVVPALPDRGRLGHSDVNRLRAPLTVLIDTDDRVGGVDLAQEATWHARRVLTVRRNYASSAAVSDKLYALAGEYLAAAGWFAIDADELDQAGAVLPEALQMANLAGDHLLIAQVWNHSAMRARQAGDYGEINQIARAALQSPAARQHPRIAALFHCRAAYGRARLGERRQAQRSLQRAHEALARPADAETPSWLEFVNPAQLYAQAALVYGVLGQWPAAVASAQQDLALIPDGFGRNRVHGQLHLANACLKVRHPEQAAEAATTAVHASAGLSGSLTHGRVAGRLCRLRQRMQPWQAVPEVRTWIELYDTALTAA